ncbi:hypothetical protein LJC42_05055 [Eubacteriales bacterium OttesenSCG-928-K08]|nr:hypothetical protein [Eubacteriales bacterium OttesenSCG-928-K08]
MKNRRWILAAISLAILVATSLLCFTLLSEQAVGSPANTIMGIAVALSGIAATWAIEKSIEEKFQA